VTYLDTSAALAWLLVEDRAPHQGIWSEQLVSSRLLEYEMWVTLHARSLAREFGDDAQTLLRRMALIELSPIVLGRALERFPRPVRTLDALHLASMSYLRDRGERVTLASYDERLLAAARALDFDAYAL
jgi:hypothetical protein